MAGGFDKQAASRPIGPAGYQVLQYNSATTFSAKFQSATQQIRIMSQIGGWGSIVDTTVGSSATVVTSAGGIGMIITGLTTGYPAAATVVGGSPYPEYFAVTPGQIFMFTSTSTSTGAVSVTEMC